MFDHRTPPRVTEAARKLGLVHEASPEHFGSIAALIDDAMSKLYPPMKLTGDLAKTATALRLTADDSQQVAILTARQRRDAEAIDAVPEDARRMVEGMFGGDRAAVAQFLAQRNGEGSP